MLGIGMGELLVLASLACVGFSMLVFGSMFIVTLVQTIQGKGDWGINLKGAACPQCGAKAPTFRMPKNARQALWGGWTCTACNIDMDKWGKREG